MNLINAAGLIESSSAGFRSETQHGAGTALGQTSALITGTKKNRDSERESEREKGIWIGEKEDG